MREYKVGDFKADVWFEPCVVWEIKGADLQLSPVYTAGMYEVGGEKGIGMR
jgi:DNA ligase 1